MRRVSGTIPAPIRQLEIPSEGQRSRREVSHISRCEAVTVGPVSNPDWSGGGLLVLKVEDVRGLSEALMRESEGRRRPLWI
jgi:hypothetical protein